MNHTFYIRTKSGFHLEELYFNQTRYKVVSSEKDMLELSQKILAHDANEIISFPAQAAFDSPVSFIINDQFLSRRLFITERPIHANGARRMEIIISGNRSAFATFFLSVNKWYQKHYLKTGVCELVFDGISDQIVMPFCCCLCFVPKYLEHEAMLYNENFFYPDDLKYIHPNQESEDEHRNILIDLRDFLLTRIANSL